MKICFIGDSSSIHTKRWYHFFKNKGYSVHIITWKNAPELPQERIHILKESLLTRLRFIRAFFISLWVIKKIREINPDIIHIHMISRYSLGCLFIKDIPVIISIGGYDILKVSDISWIHFFINKKILKRADGITTSSRDIKLKLINRFGVDEKKIKCFCWGIDFKLFSSFTSEDSKINKKKYNIPEDYIVLFHNRYFPAAKYRIVFESIKKLNNKFSDFVLIVVKGITSEDDWADVIKYAEELKLNDKIIFVNRYLSQNDMAEYLSFSDIYFNILTHDQRGLSILEAMAGGCIPAVNDMPVYREFINDDINGIIFKSEEPESIADRLYLIIQNLKELKQKFKLYNHEYIGKNDDKEVNEKMMDTLYSDVINNFKKQ